MNRTSSEKTIIIQTTDDMDNWLHPQTPERKQRIKQRMAATVERFQKMSRRTTKRSALLNHHIIITGQKPISTDRAGRIKLVHQDKRIVRAVIKTKKH